MGDIIPVAEDVVEFIKRGTESEQIALENLKTIAPVIKKQMTKHDIREKEGKKIWEIIKQCYNPGLCPVCFGEEKECLVCAADAVCDYMLNKIEEARKETMKEVMSYLHELSRDDMYTEEGYCFDFIERMFCEKFGVEKATSSSNSKPEVVE